MWIYARDLNEVKIFDKLLIGSIIQLLTIKIEDMTEQEQVREILADIKQVVDNSPEVVAEEVPATAEEILADINRTSESI